MSSTWSNLSSLDKEAFYSILDQYFESRPHLFQSTSSGPSNGNSNNLTTHSALTHLATAHPSAASSALKAAGVSATPGQVSTAAAASSKLNGLGSRVSQFAGQWNKQDQQQPPPGVSTKPAGPPPAHNKFIGGLVTQADRQQQQAKPSSSSTNTTQSNPFSTSFAPPPIRRTPAPQAASIQKPKYARDDDDGEYVEAVYDYDGTSPEDLSFKEHQVIKVTEHISEDWWNGQIDGGPIGMFPSSYVKPI